MAASLQVFLIAHWRRSGTLGSRHIGFGTECTENMANMCGSEPDPIFTHVLDWSDTSPACVFVHQKGQLSSDV